MRSVPNVGSPTVPPGCSDDNSDIDACVARCSNTCYANAMTREISVRDLRNHTAEVVAAVKSGERLSLTVNRLPVADIVPHQPQRNPWVSSERLRSIVEEAGADRELLVDLADVRSTLLDGP
jgi:prevent-host-death family protein